MLNKDHLKNYMYFLISLMLFVVIIAYSSFLYIGWDKEIDPSEAEVEINLPVIDWNKYLNLSKQPE